MIHVVTGAGGFLGYHLCYLLLSRGEEVIGVDNFCTGTLENIVDLMNDFPRFKFYQQDVREPFLQRYTRTINRVWHLACPASPERYQEDMISTLDTCYLGTRNALELALNNGARLLLASTSEIYGDPEMHPQKESYRGCVNILGPRACYDEGKRIAESLCWSFGKQAGVDYRIARIFNTYGPRMNPHDGRVIINFLNALLEGQPLIIYGNGTQTRSFAYVSDTIRGLDLLMKSEVTDPVNIGSEREVTINQLSHLVATLGDHPVQFDRKPLPVDDPQRRRPDLTRARNLLTFEPTVSLVDGLKSTLAWMRGNRG